MKKLLIPLIIFLLLFALVRCGASYVVNETNKEFKKSVEAITQHEMNLNDITKFKWDTVYTFEPYTSKKRIEDTIGFKSKHIRETVNEGMEQLIFVKDKAIVCSIYGYSSNLGYTFNFGDLDNGYLALNSKDNPSFTVEKSDSIIRLILTN